jgi:phospholipid N-methyltransferase
MCFLREFFKHPKEVGTFTQSSKTLARRIAREINGNTKVVEFGPGTGAITVEILKRLPQNGQLTCVDINPSFCEHLSRFNDARLRVVNDDARNCERHVDGPQCVVSGLPLMLFSKADKIQFLDKVSKADRFIQLQYTPLLTRRLSSYFPQVEVRFVAQNFPPAFICVCSKRSSK